MNEFQPTVTISLKEYDRLRSFEHVFKIKNKDVIEVINRFAFDDFEFRRAEFFQLKRKAYELLETEYFKESSSL